MLWLVPRDYAWKICYDYRRKHVLFSIQELRCHRSHSVVDWAHLATFVDSMHRRRCQHRWVSRFFGTGSRRPSSSPMWCDGCTHARHRHSSGQNKPNSNYHRGPNSNSTGFPLRKIFIIFESKKKREKWCLKTLWFSKSSFYCRQSFYLTLQVPFEPFEGFDVDGESVVGELSPQSLIACPLENT